MNAAGDGNGLRVGITPWIDDWDGAADGLARQAELAETLGYHSFWLPESHFAGRGSNPAPLLRLAAVASRTQRLGIGTTSFLLPVRHPIHVAEEVAVLDRLSNGRVLLGVGRGFRSSLFAAFDVPAGEKRDRFEAALEVIRKAWTGVPLVRDPGERDAAPTAVHLAPLPVQQPHPPIWVAAFGPKAVNQAGRLGLPYLASPVEPVAALEENYARHREALPEETDAAELAVPIMRTVFVSRRPEVLARAHENLLRQTAAMARTGVRAIQRAADAEVEDIAILGEPKQTAERIAAVRERLGMTHLIVRTHIPGMPPEALEESVREVAELEIG